MRAGYLAEQSTNYCSLLYAFWLALNYHYSTIYLSIKGDFKLHDLVVIISEHTIPPQYTLSRG
jgi:hypothetical protein